MTIEPILANRKKPILIAGPCSAETEAQTLETAHALAATGRVDFFRAGVWKPRTRPNSFEGVGPVGLGWLQKVKKETGLAVCTEVASAHHVELALRAEIDLLWIGARSTVNPFTVQEIADALRGSDLPILIKNPVNADLDLWIGAIERVSAAGIRRIGAIHRGFSHFGKTPFRNVPLWQLPIELMRRMPELTILNDPSHICGNRHLLAETAQKALDLQMHGLMIETHPRPDEAWSDAKQQITPERWTELIEGLVVRKAMSKNIEFADQLDALRRQIDQLDAEMLEIFEKRMNLAERIGQIKRESNVAILQPQRWNDILRRAHERAPEMGLSPTFVEAIFQAAHQESINRQSAAMRAVEA